MSNRLASLAMSTSVLKALPGKLDIKRHSRSIFYIFVCLCSICSNYLPSAAIDWSFFWDSCMVMFNLFIDTNIRFFV